MGIISHELWGHATDWHTHSYHIEMALNFIPTFDIITTQYFTIEVILIGRITDWIGFSVHSASVWSDGSLTIWMVNSANHHRMMRWKISIFLSIERKELLTASHCGRIDRRISIRQITIKYFLFNCPHTHTHGSFFVFASREQSNYLDRSISSNCRGFLYFSHVKLTVARNA